MTHLLRILLPLAIGTAAAGASAIPGADPFAHVPAQGPRTLVLAGQRDAFRAYVTTGEGARAFARIREDFDREFLNLPFPPEPAPYKDANPGPRTSAETDGWRAAQDTANIVATTAEAATLLWLGTGEARYLAKAREFLLASTAWSHDPATGTTSIDYNDEAFFRLWRKLPAVFDQIRHELTPAERARVIGHFRERGRRSVAWIREAGTDRLVRNSLEVLPSSHPVRFMAMTATSGLALWDDVPEARSWWQFAYEFYRDRFPPWAGDDGGWAEGAAYWRGTVEHASFQDLLLALGDPFAYHQPFWRNSPFFGVYTFQPYWATQFGNTGQRGAVWLEPMVADYLEHAGRVMRDGRLTAYARLFDGSEPLPGDRGLRGIDRRYPTSTEFLVRDFIASRFPPQEPDHAFTNLPAARHFSDVGWVIFRSALGRPGDDIHLTFKSSPYGSFSHSHADQNAFILNAYGENLAIASGYREFHNSPHVMAWTRQTKSKNAILLDGRGQKILDRDADGRIIRFAGGDRWVWTTGDATVAYQTMQEKGRVLRVTRDVVWIDRRYFLVRDQAELATPFALTWMLHAPDNLAWDAAAGTATISRPRASLAVHLVARDTGWRTGTWRGFEVKIDDAYPWPDQSHLAAVTTDKRKRHEVWAVLWPERGPTPARATLTAAPDGTLTIVRPDGKTDVITLDEAASRVWLR